MLKLSDEFLQQQRKFLTDCPWTKGSLVELLLGHISALESLIPPDTASLWDRKLAEARENEHAKLCPQCSIFPSEKSGCKRISELRRAVGKGEAE